MMTLCDNLECQPDPSTYHLSTPHSQTLANAGKKSQINDEYSSINLVSLS